MTTTAHTTNSLTNQTHTEEDDSKEYASLMAMILARHGEFSGVAGRSSFNPDGANSTPPPVTGPASPRLGRFDYSGIPVPHSRSYFSADTERAIQMAAERRGLNPLAMHRIAEIESSGNPSAVTGSYQGLYQLSSAEFNKNGGGNIFSANDNAMAAAAKLDAESKSFKSRFGRDPNVAELYLIHQQGLGGAMAHWSNPDAPAWQNMASTAEGRSRGAGWAKAAIWGNVPDNLKARYGSVENMTSRDFVEMWAHKTGTENIYASGPQLAHADQPRPSIGGLKTAMANIESFFTGHKPAKTEAPANGKPTINPTTPVV